MKKILVLSAILIFILPTVSSKTLSIHVMHFGNELSKPGFHARVSSATKSKYWIKNAWSSLSPADIENRPVFYPVNAMRPGFDHAADDYSLATFALQDSAIQFNLWQILIYHFMKGDLVAYFPYNPEWFDASDRGYLLYPFGVNSNPGATYFTDENFRSEVRLRELIGFTEHSTETMPMHSREYPEEDSVDAYGNFVYYPKPFIWYTENDIISYELKESWTIDETGTVISKKIDAIAPIVNRVDSYGWTITGSKHLFWIDFDQLRPVLANYYLIKNDECCKKVLSFKEYFDLRKFDLNLVAEDSLHVRPAGK